MSAYELNAAIAAIDANIGFDDYNPPDICASCVQEAQENRTAAFKDDVADSLDDLDLEDAASDQLNSTASFIDFTLSGLKKSSQNLAWFRTFDYTNPGIVRRPPTEHSLL